MTAACFSTAASLRSLLTGGAMISSGSSVLASTWSADADAGFFSEAA
jgi:hypothetical protein